MNKSHYASWRKHYRKNLMEMYNIFLYYFKDLYVFDKSSKEKFYRFIYTTQFDEQLR